MSLYKQYGIYHFYYRDDSGKRRSRTTGASTKSAALEVDLFQVPIAGQGQYEERPESLWRARILLRESCLAATECSSIHRRNPVHRVVHLHGLEVRVDLVYAAIGLGMRLHH